MSNGMWCVYHDSGWWLIVHNNQIVDGFRDEDDARQYLVHLMRKESANA